MDIWVSTETTPSQIPACSSDDNVVAMQLGVSSLGDWGLGHISHLWKAMEEHSIMGGFVH